MTDKKALIKTLRDRTGMGYSECTAALKANDNDIEAAITYLREKDAANFEKRKDRETGEGHVEIVISDDLKRGVLVVCRCETDFVSRSGEFQSAVKDVADRLLLDPSEGENLKDIQQNMVSVFKENVDFNINVMVAKDTPNSSIYGYNHSNRIGVLLTIETEDATLAQNVAMHIASEDPQAISVEEFESTEEYSKEKAFLLDQVNKTMSDKPDELKEKITQGKISKFVASQVLLEQKLVMDTDVSVKKYIKNASITSFVRESIG